MAADGAVADFRRDDWNIPATARIGPLSAANFRQVVVKEQGEGPTEYQHVYLRLLPVGGGTPRVIANVYGGQGTFNVPSWSPDSRILAFVSNTGTVE